MARTAARKKKVQGPKSRNSWLFYLTLAIFIAVVFACLYAARRPGQSGPGEIVDKLTYSPWADSRYAFLYGNRIVSSRLDELANVDYETLKAELGIDRDFIIYFEDEDGNLVPVAGRSCIGSPSMNVAGEQCG